LKEEIKLIGMTLIIDVVIKVCVILLIIGCLMIVRSEFFLGGIILISLSVLISAVYLCGFIKERKRIE
jgi:hypothetical protein